MHQSGVSEMKIGAYVDLGRIGPYSVLYWSMAVYSVTIITAKDPRHSVFSFLFFFFVEWDVVSGRRRQVQNHDDVEWTAVM